MRCYWIWKQHLKMKKLLIKFIEFYQKFLSFDTGMLAIFAPGGACKYPISCSEYTKQAILQQGIYKGLNLGVRRIFSCR